MMSIIIGAALEVAYFGFALAALDEQWTMSATLLTVVVFGVTPNMAQIPSVPERICALAGAYALVALFWLVAVMMMQKERNG